MMSVLNTRLAAAAALLVTAQPAWAAGAPDMSTRIEAAMGGTHRSVESVARNRYRHPVGTLTFFGLKPDMRVLEIWPGGGWYTEVLAPLLREDGELVVADWDQSVEGQPNYRYELPRMLRAKFEAHPGIYDRVGVQPFSPPASASLGQSNSFDMVLTFRNVHGWVGSGQAPLIFAEFARVLKPGGVLGVVQHRADAGEDPAESAQRGYVSEEAVVALARNAGLYLEARSNVNDNAADRKDHERGVWTLPPGLALCGDIEDEEEREECAARYRAIGESDRMTLRFRKPLM